MHGGTENSLPCPIPNCIRSSGVGFTRKENLHEHIRRVHPLWHKSANLSDLKHNRESDSSMSERDREDLSAEINILRKKMVKKDARLPELEQALQHQTGK
jgi:uncharacterized protein YihD (DUF1040 family)